MRQADTWFKQINMALAGLLLLVIVLIVVVLAYFSWPSWQHNHWQFLFNGQWQPSRGLYGAANILIDTAITTAIALMIAVPLSLLSAIALAHLLPTRLTAISGLLVETMAAIPSIVYGVWGLFILAPLLANNVYPHLLNPPKGLQVLAHLFRGLPVGTNLFTAGIILAIMIYPLMTAMMRDVFNMIPDLLIESAYGCGLNSWQVVYHIFLHYARAGLFGSIVLGLSRAFGETMAVSFVIGNAHHAFKGLLYPGATVASTIANEFSEAFDPIYKSSLLHLGFVLLIFSLAILIGARYIIHRGVIRGGTM